MPLALGRRLFFHQIFGGGGFILIVAIVAVVLLVKFWPAIVGWFEARKRG